jgi:hypothetical protein
MAGVVGGLLLFAACSTDTPDAAHDPATAPATLSGSIDIAVGGDVRAFGLQKATCEVVDAGGVRVLNVFAPAAGVHTVDGVRTRPNLLTARLPADLGSQEHSFGPTEVSYGAIASVAGAEYADEAYPLLQIIAHSVHNKPVRDGADGYECKASRDGDEISVVCNGGKVFPWSAPGVVPSGSFKAMVVCGAGR